MFLLNRHKRLFKRFLFLLLPYSFLRVGFYFYHSSLYKQFSVSEIFHSFLLGVRFDVAAICLLNIPIIFLSLIPSNHSKFVFFERFLFVLINSIGVLVSLIDYELFLFMGKRVSFDLFAILDDIWAQLPQLTLHYWYFPLACILYGISFYFLDRKFFSFTQTRRTFFTQVVSSHILLVLSFIGIRGGLQYKSINVQSAFTQGKNELGHLVLNSPYHFFRTLKNKRHKKLKHFASDNEAMRIILERRHLGQGNTQKNEKNIVLIILESFSLEYVENGYTPFLNELKSKSLYFPFHLANGRRSIEALPSLLCGLPSLIDEPLSKSIYQSNKFICMPKILKDLGYTNYFFHGGSRGTMGFDTYTLSAGFDRYFSKEDAPGGHFDGTWGIYDGPYLAYTAEVLGKMKPPFLAGIFTLSSHQPYSVPKELKGKFPQGTLEIHESIGYADYALRLFFEKIKNEPWFLNTIFFITADHTSKLESQKFQNLIGQYRVPLLIYDPSSKFGAREVLKVSQHSDIPRTIVNLVGANKNNLAATSIDLLSSDNGYGINYADGQEYFLASASQLFRLSKEGKQTEYHYDWSTGKMQVIGPSQDPLLKAYIQYFVNGLINNNLTNFQ